MTLLLVFTAAFLGAVAGVLMGVPAAVSIAAFWHRSPAGQAVNRAIARAAGGASTLEQQPPKAVVHPPTRSV